LQSLSLQDQAQVLFHMHYNPALERVYELPGCTDVKRTKERYVGDKGLVLALSYHHQQHQDYSYPAQQIGYPQPSASMPHIKIEWLRVTLAWVLSGIKPDIAPTQIYPQRYARLGHALARHGYFKYDPLSEVVLSHIVHRDDMHNSDDVELDLLDYVQAHTHECHTRLSRLQHMLEGSGVDSRVIWKYTFAKSYVIGNGSLLGEEDVVRRIQDSEEEWRLKQQSIARRI
ncbi:hypothetical protein BCR43DRAFT_413502, partial [Syncephalastrum racemosum]